MRKPWLKQVIVFGVLLVMHVTFLAFAESNTTTPAQTEVQKIVNMHEKGQYKECIRQTVKILRSNPERSYDSDQVIILWEIYFDSMIKLSKDPYSYMGWSKSMKTFVREYPNYVHKPDANEIFREVHSKAQKSVIKGKSGEYWRHRGWQEKVTGIVMWSVGGATLLGGLSALIYDRNVPEEDSLSMDEFMTAYGCVLGGGLFAGLGVWPFVYGRDHERLGNRMLDESISSKEDGFSLQIGFSVVRDQPYFLIGSKF